MKIKKYEFGHMTNMAAMPIQGQNPLKFFSGIMKLGMCGGGRVVQMCLVSYVTGASNWYWLTIWQGLLSL